LDWKGRYNHVNSQAVQQAVQQQQHFVYYSIASSWCCCCIHSGRLSDSSESVWTDRGSRLSRAEQSRAELNCHRRQPPQELWAARGPVAP
jgi:hypothetical protein